MAQTCSICRHPKKAEIDKALIAGDSLRDVAVRTGTSKTALSRHKLSHIPAKLAKAKEASEQYEADSLLSRLESLTRETTEILKAARASKNWTVVLGAIARLEKQVELQARLRGELDKKDPGGGLPPVQLIVVRPPLPPAEPAAAVPVAPSHHLPPARVLQIGPPPRAKRR